ncbi:MAG: glycosyltransferase family 4 protein [Desulfomonilaceae bacterium]
MNFHLGLFFTRGVSLRTWDMVGNLDREIAVYLRMIDDGNRVSFFTYGDSGDLKYLDRLGGIEICCNQYGQELEQYESDLARIHYDTCESLDIIKTNQTYGSELALDVATKFGKRLVSRCGYMWSRNCRLEHGADAEVTKYALRVENKVFTVADRVFVTTPAMRQDVLSRISGVENRVVVIPNYVDTKVFRPINVPKYDDTLIFVGRIAREKNLEALFEAVRPLDVKLRIVGEGKLRPLLQDKYRDLGDKLVWEGGVRNSELPEYINGAKVFILPSFYEGHPKALIEAMACAVPVIGCDSPGIREIIRDGYNGLLCPTDPDGLRNAILRVLKDHEMAKSLGIRARNYVVENYSLESVGRLELSILNDIHRSRLNDAGPE